MNGPIDPVYQDIQSWARAHGIEITLRPLEPGKAGEFNGRSATMNTTYPVEESAYYLVHALGSIVRWSLSQPVVQAMFHELRDAKKERYTNSQRLAKAIENYRAFEIESSEFAVWILNQLGHAEVIPSYTNFMRADLEALTEFHRIGKAPVWRDYFARWNEEAAQGRRSPQPFTPKPVPSFQPKHVENQEIFQEQGDGS